MGFESLSRAANANYIGMDDDPSSGCENNLSWGNSWETPTSSWIADSHNFHITASGTGKPNASHTLGYGYQVTSSNCVIKDYQGECVAARACSTLQTTKVDDRTLKMTATANQSSYDAAGDISFRGHINFVECTQDSQCLAGNQPIS